MVAEVLDIDIKNYIVDSFVPPKLLGVGVQLLPVEESKQRESCKVQASHAQLKCDVAKFPFGRSDVIASTLQRAQVLVVGDETTGTKHIWEVCFDAKPFNGIDVQPGDTIGILPKNRAEDVQKVLHALKLEAAAHTYYQLITVEQLNKKSKPTKLPAYIPTVITPIELLSDCLNLRAVPKKQMLQALASCCTNETETAFLSCLSSKEGAQYYNELILVRGLTLIDLLELCSTCQPNLELLVEHLPRLLPRPYSIANSTLSTANEFSIIFSVRLQQPGLTSSWLAQLAEEQNAAQLTPTTVPMYIREPTKFRYTTEDAANNQLLICIGTGLAPFIGFLEHKSKCKNIRLGETWLCVGATSATHVLHRQRLKEWQEKGMLNQYNEALSRDDKKPQYIQQLLQNDSKKYIEFLQQANTYLYVCADGAIISAAINNCLAECLQKELHINDFEAAQLLKEWRKNGKFLEDIWL